MTRGSTAAYRATLVGPLDYHYYRGLWAIARHGARVAAREYMRRRAERPWWVTGERK